MLFEQCFAGQPSVNARDMAASWRPSYGEWLGAQAAEGFDRTISGRYLEEKGLALAEMQAGDYDPAWSLRNNETMSPMERAFVLKGWMPPAPDHAHAMTEADWKASPWYRKEISFRPDMTATRARIMAENFDRRRYRERLLARGNELYDDAEDMALGFGAGLLGSLPDPINLLPLGGGAAAGSGAATLGRKLLRGAKAGAVNGAVSTAVSDALVLPDLASRGEDADFVDLLLDTLAGCFLGGVFGTPIFLTSSLDSGSFVRAARAGDDPAPFASSPDSGFLARAGVEATPFDRTPDGDLMARAGYAEAVPDASGEATAARVGDAAVDAESLPARNADNDLLRQGWTAGERRAVARAADLNLENMDDGRSAELAILQESKALERAYDAVLRDPLGGDPEKALVTLEPEDIERVFVQRGPAVMKDGQIKVQGPELEKANLGKRGYGIVKIIFLHGVGGNKRPDMPPVTREDVIALPRMVREYESILENNRHRIWRIPREDGYALHIVASLQDEQQGSMLVSMYVGPLKPEQTFSIKKPRVASSIPAVNEDGDTGRGILISHPTGDNGASHKTGFSMPDAAVPVNRSASDISTTAEPPAPSRMTPEAARQAEAGALAGQDESLRQRLADVEKRGAVDAGETAARTEDGLAGVPDSEARKK